MSDCKSVELRGRGKYTMNLLQTKLKMMSVRKGASIKQKKNEWGGHKKQCI